MKSIQLLACTALMALCCLDMAPAHADRAWTTEDSIAVRYFVDQQDNPSMIGPREAGQDETIVAAPDGRHFFFIQRHGELACDCNEYELDVFATETLAQVFADEQRMRRWQPQPLRRVIQRGGRSGIGMDPMSGARWLGSSTIIFSGVKDKGSLQIYSLDVKTGELRQLSASEGHAIAFELFRGRPLVGVSGESVIYPTSVVTPIGQGVGENYPVVVIKGGEVLRMVGATEASFALVASYRAGPHRRIATTTQIPQMLSLSPDDRTAIGVFTPADLAAPKTWAAYGSDAMPSTGNLDRFVAIDLERGTTRPLLDAPSGRATIDGFQTYPNVLWYDHGQRAILVNTALPLPRQAKEPSGTPYLVDYDLRSQRWTPIAALRPPANAKQRKPGEWFVEASEWVQEGQSFVIRYADVGFPPFRSPTSTVTYSHKGSRWMARIGKPQPPAPILPSRILQDGIKVFVRQSADRAPIVIASNKEFEIPLVQSDPALTGIWRAPMKEVQWPGGGRPNGQSWVAIAA